MGVGFIFLLGCGPDTTTAMLAVATRPVGAGVEEDEDSCAVVGAALGVEATAAAAWVAGAEVSGGGGDGERSR